jgi:hypothetical protein
MACPMVLVETRTIGELETTRHVDERSIIGTIGADFSSLSSGPEPIADNGGVAFPRHRGPKLLDRDTAAREESFGGNRTAGLTGAAI